MSCDRCNYTALQAPLLNVKNAELVELGGGPPSLICRTSRLPEGWVPIAFLSLGIVACLGLAYYVYFNFHEFHFHLSRNRKAKKSFPNLPRKCHGQLEII